MLQAISSANPKINFRSEPAENKAENKAEKETHLLPNTPKTKLKQGSQKLMSAVIDYPVKGLRGDINSNFYEFLTMGIVPYIAGSAMFMLVFNITKHLDAKGHKTASNIGRKMAMGVLLYGILKSLSKNLVTIPVKAATGVDTEMPYQNKVYNLPKGAGENANIEVQWQQRKVFDSKEFYRKDLLDRKYFNNVAKKIGLGEKLNDSVSETSPIIQNIVATSNTAKSLSSYCWAAVGVGMAVQDAWPEFFNTLANKKHHRNNKTDGFFKKTWDRTKIFGENLWNGITSCIKSLGKSFAQLWKGKPNHSGFMKHAGKALILFAALTTSTLTANTIIRAKKLAQNTNKKTIDETKESTEI